MGEDIEQQAHEHPQADEEHVLPVVRAGIDQPLELHDVSDGAEAVGRETRHSMGQAPEDNQRASPQERPDIVVDHVGLKGGSDDGIWGGCKPANNKVIRRRARKDDQPYILRPCLPANLTYSAPVL